MKSTKSKHSSLKHEEFCTKFLLSSEIQEVCVATHVVE